MRRLLFGRPCTRATQFLTSTLVMPQFIGTSAQKVRLRLYHTVVIIVVIHLRLLVHLLVPLLVYFFVKLLDHILVHLLVELLVHLLEQLFSQLSLLLLIRSLFGSALALCPLSPTVIISVQIGLKFLL